MESFFRYVTYIDYYKNQEKVKNVGFLKWKLCNGEHALEMRIRGLSKEHNSCPIAEINTGKRIGDLTVEQGMGSFEKKYPAKTASGEDYIEINMQRLYLKDIAGFEMKIAANEYLKTEIVFEDKREPAMINYVEIAEQLTEEIIEIQTEEKNVLLHGYPEKYELPIMEEEVEIIKPLPEDKWEQLCMEYPKVHPFSNGREFLVIKPKDFVVLRREYQKLVNNSFLLHGFYNYGHMILGKLSKEVDAQVYVGVPGVYYEPEKQAAQIFGFVGFEGTSQPVTQGSYGYYMIEVEI